jgi:beta-glucosidase
VPTAAVEAYRDIIAQNGVPAGYTPTRAPTFCSLVNGVRSCLDSLG